MEWEDASLLVGMHGREQGRKELETASCGSSSEEFFCKGIAHLL